MTTYLVTGGAGFIGSHITTALVKRGDKVRVVDDLSSGFETNLDHIRDDVEFVKGDAADPSLMSRMSEGVEVVYHEAALASVPASVRDPMASHRECATSTVNVLTCAQRAGVRRVVLAASSAAYGDQPKPVKQETDPLDLLSPYAAAKIASELYCQAFTKSMGIETVALRYFNVYGPRQDPASEYSAVIPIFVSKMLAGERPTIFGDGLQSRDFVFVSDVVAANLLAADAEKAVGESINVACGGQSTLLDLMAAINAALGTEVQPEFAPPRTGDVRNSMADISKARDCLGYEPAVDLAEGLKRSIEYYRSIAG
ncbi:SDR family oxidoreductase [Aeoliella sp. ICT_H6.2]|uniref:SDR family oxidoreductase n=1 Tax=Aeoliella straminimaris TaxID=2954799 RepID=A0A9X2F595_9BACT|nr:SDR family oxidoreductase [Aeoliella straminimaris]MCO6042512.1 SDR family oxidoreductase [Aeoliella straminimaris]